MKDAKDWEPIQGRDWCMAFVSEPRPKTLQIEDLIGEEGIFIRASSRDCEIEGSENYQLCEILRHFPMDKSTSIWVQIIRPEDLDNGPNLVPQRHRSENWRMRLVHPVMTFRENAFRENGI